MKKIITLSTFITIVVFSIAFISCGSSGDDTPVGNIENIVTNYQIKLSETTLVFDFEATEKQVQLTTDVDWIATTSVSWIHISPSYGKSSANVAISVDANNSNEDRKADIIFKNDKNSVTLHVSQNKQEQKPNIGDYLYSDGTWGSTLDKEKIPIAVVFSIETSVKDKKLGYKNGYAMAIVTPLFATGGSGWLYKPVWSDSEENVFGINYSSMEDVFNDKDGLSKTLEIVDKVGYVDDYSTQKKNEAAYPAFFAAYDCYVERAESMSCWFLPSAGQWHDIIENLGGLSSQYSFLSYTAGDAIWEESTTVIDKLNSYIKPCIDLPYYNRYLAMPGTGSSKSYWLFGSEAYHTSTEKSSSSAYCMHFAINEGWYLKGTDYSAFYYFTRIGTIDKTNSFLARATVRPCIAF